MVNERRGVSSQVLKQELHELAKGGPLLLVIMRPKLFEMRLPVVQKTEAEKILQAIGVQWVALHVERERTRIWFCRARKATTRCAADLLAFVLAGPAFVLLEVGLRP